MLLQSGIYSLSPNWMGVFQKWDNLKRFQKEALVTDLGYFNKNPVAEAYQWDCSYFNKESDKYCAECSWFGWSYTYVVTGDMTLDKEIVELKGGQFADHWDSHHNGSSSSSDVGAKTKTNSLVTNKQEDRSQKPSSSLNGRKKALRDSERLESS